MAFRLISDPPDDEWGFTMSNTRTKPGSYRTPRLPDRAATRPGSRGGRTRGRLAIMTAAASAALVVLTACSSSSTSGSASSGSGTASGPSIKIGVIEPVDTSVYNTPDAVAAIKAAAYAQNQAGGINGHKIEIDFCNEAADPNKATTCARKMVSDKVVATVYTLSISGAGVQIADILKAAGIPQIDEASTSVPENGLLNSYNPVPGLTIEYAGIMHQAASQGLKKLFLYGGTTTTFGQVQKLALLDGIQVVGSTTMPNTVADFAPLIQKYSSSGADFALMGTSTNQEIALINAGATSGTKVRWATNIESLTPDAIKTLGSKMDGMLLAGGLPPISATADFSDLKTFAAQVAAYHQASGDADANVATMSQGALGARASVGAIVAVARTVPDVTAASLTQALDSAKGLQLPLIGSWTPSNRLPSPFQAYSNANVYLLTVQNSQVVLDKSAKSPYDAWSTMTAFSS
jgi:ABC-type branched-subunit amino acid transport system substrate-binding protein